MLIVASRVPATWWYNIFVITLFVHLVRYRPPVRLIRSVLVTYALPTRQIWWCHRLIVGPTAPIFQWHRMDVNIQYLVRHRNRAVHLVIIHTGQYRLSMRHPMIQTIILQTNVRSAIRAPQKVSIFSVITVAKTHTIHYRIWICRTVINNLDTMRTVVVI